MDTCCYDNKNQVPTFYKTVEVANFDEANIQNDYCEQRKNTPKNLLEGYDINHVPPFIFYKNDKEIGRFVEGPIETIKEDFLK
ncbi:MAG: hypothetical protein COB81_04940 [Flavobacteriaceae bacterium]|nr:MAG: hypothetical protein COB81_04940 [Flavobacteriaceae bacterium]